MESDALYDTFPRSQFLIQLLLLQIRRHVKLDARLNQGTTRSDRNPTCGSELQLRPLPRMVISSLPSHDHLLASLA
ncbi:hypothetical protein BLNAU_22181 [Blattamonas nauphoetae]|uniref:Uncharacterized protein n=1 Tax=Blattamonas nauphoetae TaxID=2049346 RepID=A0ABQ9WTT7_9EUKA|nr:hypothetical protein BLNAU_22181 [Blattamonas nauphoetae]